ncbi:hypothetical protein GCM10027418_20610 [Mariniluteicoccus endophyticus]
MGWGFLGDMVEAAGDGLQAIGDGITGAGQVLTGDLEGAGESFRNAGGHLADAGGNLVDAAIGSVVCPLGPVIELGKQVGQVLDGVWDGLVALKDRASSWFDGLIGSIVDGLSGIWDGIKSIFSDIWDSCRSFVEKCQEIMRALNAPTTLRETATRWREGPAKGFSALIPEVTQRQELTNSGWRAMEAEAYAQGVPNQIKAVGAAHNACNKIATSLDETADAICAFAADTGGLAGRIYAAVQGSPGSLFSLQGLSAVFGGGLSSIIDVVVGLVKFAAEQERIQKQMAETIKNDPAFINGEWPMAQTGIAIA